MRPTILLCGEGGDIEAAAAFAIATARAARLTSPAAARQAERVRDAYREACSALVCDSSQRPAVRLSIDAETLKPKFELVSTAERGARATPRALRALRARAFLKERSKRAETGA
ncbi:MAG: hypothetical protein ACK5MQ_10970 [Pikeienuella sp.]